MGVLFLSVLYVQDGLKGEPRLLLDPNTLSADGTVAISAAEPSRDGEIYAYGLSSKGSDWVTLHVKNVSTGKDFPEVLLHTKWPGIEWTADNAGFFYNVSHPKLVHIGTCALGTNAFNPNTFLNLNRATHNRMERLTGRRQLQMST
jgi:protease II